MLFCTYNIHYGVGADGRYDVARVADAVADADIVVDAADSFAVTYILSDACQAAAKPLVSASVIGSGPVDGEYPSDHFGVAATVSVR